ncbi:M23 family peptidase [Mucilaginibacter terrenus]|uniref:M23 family peptidase n=1 Tax=Mucilaginibacter terrenus TaxID=2482727 RepID=A0A3E2NL49_9SPHI|nr:M23 family metallopeptidase [Mucilaginibacter terrenus]RFZ81708.1 M23 family peptidase [Mucilaginibacter terrenus]
MKKLLAFIVFLFIADAALAQADSTVYDKFNTFNNQVLKGKVTKADAQKKFKEFKAFLLKQSASTGSGNGANWAFPLEGYSYKAVGGTNGNGYSDKGFRYLDGNKHGAHPAHDIFISDKNQDCMDDHMLKPVNVLAVKAGIVVACTNQWDAQGNMRGGRYIWIYHPEGFFTYYAHNRQIFVKPGDNVQEGQKIAEVGRTGFNAYQKRSPTHLHFSAFKLADDIPAPFNPYTQLKSAITK